MSSGCPLKRLSNNAYIRLIYLHVVVFMSLLGFSAAFKQGNGAGARAGGGCPFAARTSRTSLTAFQSPASGASALLSSASSRCLAGKAVQSSCPFASTSGQQQRTAGLRRKRSRAALQMSAVEKQQKASSATATATRGPAVETLSPQEEALLTKLDKVKRKQQSNVPLQVHVIGLSHHNAAVEVRERLAVPEPEWNTESARLCTSDVVAEAAVLSTCNRFEVYVASHDAHAAIRDTITLLQERSGLDQATLRRSLFILSAEDAVWHILRVSAGLDSLVVGEGQILSQVRQCYLHGTEEDGCAGKVVARLLNTAVSAGKRVRSETSISKGAVSISSAAAEFSKFRCEPDLKCAFDQARITIVGAGTMSRLLLIHLQSLGVKRVTLVNRSMPKCLELQAEFPDLEFTIKLSDELEATLLQSDVVYTSTTATGCIITQPQLEAIGAGKEKPLMFVDISVPRNVESECNEVEGVFAYDVDDLKMVVARNTALRRREMLEAEAILHEEQLKFRGWQESLTAIPAISKMQEKFESMRAEEVRKAANKLANLNKKEMEVVEKLSKGIVNKMLHGPMSALRSPEGPEEKKRTLFLLKSMFKLQSEFLAEE